MTDALLLDIHEIQQLKYRYFRVLDTKQWDDFRECFVPEATASYSDGALTFEGREAIVDYMRNNMGPGLYSMHNGHHPEIQVHGDTATGIWYLQDKVLVPEFDFALEGCGLYFDEYLRTAEGWRIKHIGYRRTFETQYSLKDLGSLKLKRGTAYDG